MLFCPFFLFLFSLVSLPGCMCISTKTDFHWFSGRGDCGGIRGRGKSFSPRQVYWSNFENNGADFSGRKKLSLTFWMRRKAQKRSSLFQNFLCVFFYYDAAFSDMPAIISSSIHPSTFISRHFPLLSYFENCHNSFLNFHIFTHFPSFFLFTF